MPPREHYDQAYFQKWYRSATHRVRTPAQVERLVRFVLGAAEYVLDRPVKSVLDVGAGEGHWQPILRSLRPRIRYVGVEPSEYAVSRYGRTRGLIRGSIGTLDTLPLRAKAPAGFDLVVSCGVLNYVPVSELHRGLRAMCALTRGVAWLELFAAEDSIVGDTATMDRRSARWYRSTLRRAGFAPVGLHLHVPRYSTGLSALERP